MHASIAPSRPSWRGRVVAGLLAFLVSLTLGIPIAGAAELVPSLGVLHFKDDDQAKLFGGLALRGTLLPAVQTELGVAYRSEQQLSDQLRVRMWPVTASLWLTPVPALYAGGGVGWYHTTLDYDSSLPFADETRQEFGVHLGGGLKLPLAPTAAVDLGGRYVMLREQESRLVPERFDPDFWLTSIGLAIRF